MTTSRSVRTVTIVVLGVLAVAFAWPFVVLLSNSLKGFGQDIDGSMINIVPLPPVVTSYLTALSSVEFGKYLLNSLLYAAIAVPSGCLVALLSGYAFGTFRFRGRELLFTILISAMFLPGEVLLIPRYLVISDLGLANTIAGLLLPGMLFPLGVMIMRQTFAKIPVELREAAIVDGCSETSILFRVMLPIAMPSVATVGIFVFLGVWNSFLWPVVVLSDEDLYPVGLGVAYLAGVGGASDPRVVAAGSVLAILPVAVFFLILQRKIINGLQGSVKG